MKKLFVLAAVLLVSSSCVVREYTGTRCYQSGAQVITRCNGGVCVQTAVPTYRCYRY